ARGTRPGKADKSLMRALKLEFGPNSSVRVVEVNGEGLMGLFTAQVKSGVYTMTADYLAISLHDDVAPADQQGQIARADKQAVQSPTCTIFLQRSDTSRPKPRP